MFLNKLYTVNVIEKKLIDDFVYIVRLYILTFSVRLLALKCCNCDLWWQTKRAYWACTQHNTMQTANNRTNNKLRGFAIKSVLSVAIIDVNIRFFRVFRLDHYCWVRHTWPGWTDDIRPRRTERRTSQSWEALGTSSSLSQSSPFPRNHAMRQQIPSGMAWSEGRRPLKTPRLWQAPHTSRWWMGSRVKRPARNQSPAAATTRIKLLYSSYRWRYCSLRAYSLPFALWKVSSYLR